MSERLEWQLVPLVKEEQREFVETLAQEALALDAVLEVAPQKLDQDDQTRLLDLQHRMEACVQSPCEAAAAPAVGSRPAWKSEARKSFGDLVHGHGSVSFELFLERISTQPDCTRCPGASAYPGVSGMPCDFDLTPLSQVLADRDVQEQIQFELSSAEMLALAARLDAIRAGGWFTPAASIQPAAYLLEASRFLRFWADKGFGVAPAYVSSEDND